MREDIKLLLIYIIIGFVVAITTASFLYKDRKGYWNEYARKSFIQELKEELQKREMKDSPYLFWGVNIPFAHKDSLQKNIFREVTIINEHGKRTYKIPSFKIEHNIENNREVRSIQSYILEIDPLIADSLNLGWRRYLQEKRFSGRSVVRVSICDLWEKETKNYSNDSLIVNKADSLFSFYIGCRSEIEVTGFLFLPWWKTFFIKDVILLCGIVLISFLLPFSLKHIYVFFQNYIFKKEIVILEKHIPVIASRESDVNIYQLDAGVLFDYESRVLRRIDKSEQLTPQLADLLKLFLEAEGYLLTNVEIAEALWPNTIDAKNNIYSAIKKMRISLSHISFCTVDNKKSSYQLIIPHSIEKKD